MKIIAISGVARSGKDTIANGLAEVLKDFNPSLKIVRTSFADALKLEISQFLIDKFNIDPFSAEGTDKELIRPMLVAFGQAKRKQTKGRFWIDIVENKLKLENPDVAIISDLRFAEQDADELFWLKNNNGKLIHVSRFNKKSGKKEFVNPVNSDEENNDPILKINADFRIVWEDSRNDSELKQATKDFCEKFYYENISFFS